MTLHQFRLHFMIVVIICGTVLGAIQLPSTVSAQDDAEQLCADDSLPLGMDGTPQGDPFPVVLSGVGIRDASAVEDALDQWQVQINFTEEGSAIIEDFTATHIGETMAIAYDRVVISAPTIHTSISETAIIAGFMDEAETKRMSEQIQFSAIPINFELTEATDTRLLFEPQVPYSPETLVSALEIINLHLDVAEVGNVELTLLDENILQAVLDDAVDADRVIETIEAANRLQFVDFSGVTSEVLQAVTQPGACILTVDEIIPSDIG